MATEPHPPQFVLERNQRLSRSLLWGCQRAFFEHQGIEAWRQGLVPNFITSNPVIGRAYAQVVLGWMRDWCGGARGEGGRLLAPDPGQPFYLIELGAGAGRFAFHFLEAFRQLRARSQLRDVAFRYVMTDLPERNLEFWLSHPRLQPFLEEGLLDIARFDAERDEQLELRHSGIVLAPGTVANPLALVANYFFDSIPQDAFSLHDGVLHECLVSVASPRPEPELAAPDLLERAVVSFEDHPAEGACYGDVELDRILADYQERLDDTTFLFPSSALRCLRRLQRLAGDRLLLLSGDKGHASEDELRERSSGVSLVKHGGAFSLMVNYDAIGQYFRRRDGQVLRPIHRHVSLHVAAFLLGQPPDGHGETELAYEEAIEKFGPDDYSTLLKRLAKHYEEMSLEELLAALRWSGWDSGMLMDIFPVLVAQAESADEPLRQEVCWAIQQVWETDYPLGAEEEDLAFHLGILLYVMDRPEQALTFFEHSLRLCDEEPGTYFNQGMCHVRLRQDARALECFERALALAPDFSEAREMLSQLQSPDWRQGPEEDEEAGGAGE
ncbi:tetratricopeptide repeat protein [Archangium violaceum]|uniref:SAM-dependent methyltransferase n=1 Tax=Archangium violaceum TaxID=83451 RepID=UPI0019517D78|nr:SAM-dependent methyltransferase [Archangium violaceum]QRN95401.1 tetratricopeptide repeat protein [Archangium violaceum]